MLEGKSVNLRLMEKEELHILADWLNDPGFMGEYESQETIGDLEKSFGRAGSQWFFIEKKDGSKIGWAAKYLVGNQTTVGFGVVPDERCKGYASEAASIIVDYLFLTNNIVRVQADTSTENKASQRVLEKVGFRREGIMRSHFFSTGKWRDSWLYSILREEWKEPKILTKSGAVRLTVRFVVGCDLEEFKEYYRRNGFAGEQGTGELGITEEKIVTQDPAHLIVWRENIEIIGDAIWHETSTDEHRRGDPRDGEDREILRKLCGGKKDNIVELHEIWLREEYRGKGYAKRFFEFFEQFIRRKGYDSFVYYADHPAALAICRKRGYKEDYVKGIREFVFYCRL